MNYEMMENNKVCLKGEVVSKPEFSHEVFGEGFYEFMLKVARLSENYDLIPITISEKLLGENFDIGKIVCIKGQFRSYNKLVDGRSKLLLTVFAREIVEELEDDNPNIARICGYVCKEPVYRTTPFGREICDMLLAVNRAYNKSDYLPCIAWGRNARYIGNLSIGQKIDIMGRIQSREYQKRLDNGEIETRTAYEISISKVNLSPQEVKDANSTQELA